MRPQLEYCIRKGKKPDFRKLSEEIFDKIAEAIKTEKDLLPVKSEYLKWSYEEGYAVVVLDGDEPVGYTRLSALFAGGGDERPWLELGATWVHPDYRCEGINREMYNLLLPEHADKNILATTTNEGSLIVGQVCGFVQVCRRQLPDKVWKASCVCPSKKTGTESKDREDCRLAHGEPQTPPKIRSCFFRVTAETAARLPLPRAA